MEKPLLPARSEGSPFLEPTKPNAAAHMPEIAPQGTKHLESPGGNVPVKPHHDFHGESSLRPQTNPYPPFHRCTNVSMYRTAPHPSPTTPGVEMQWTSKIQYSFR